MARIVRVRITPPAPFVVPCPHCGRATEFATPPPGTRSDKVFEFSCTCGHPLRVLMNVRRALRKKVHLVAAATFPPARDPEVCTVDDLSLAGLSLSAYPPSAATIGGRAVVRVMLDDPRRSRLLLKGTVRRITRSGARVTVAVEFDKLPPGELAALSFYFM